MLSALPPRLLAWRQQLKSHENRHIVRLTPMSCVVSIGSMLSVMYPQMPMKGVQMARRTIVRLVNDLDDSVITEGGGQTVQFALDGREYEIDLTNEHAADMRAALDRYVRAARKLGGRQVRARGTSTKLAAPVDYSPQAVRAWAKAKRMNVSPRGRIPQSFVEQFRAAGN